MRRVVLLAPAPAAILAALLAPAPVPDRVRQHLERPHRRRRVVARDHQLAAPRALLRRPVPDREAQAGPGMQRRRERVVQDRPTRALPLEPDAADVELAVADVADRNRPVRTATRRYPPNDVDPVTASFPVGTVPETATLRFPAGSSLSTSIVAAFAPAETGANRIGTSSESPAPIASGYAATCGARNSGDDELIPVTVSVHLPLLARTSASSRNDPIQTGPKSPLSAITVLSRGAGATPDPAPVRGPPGSLLNSWNV